jgi:hypothetical protein
MEQRLERLEAQVLLDGSPFADLPARNRPAASYRRMLH